MTRDPIHPGETLREDLDAIGMSAAELSRRIEVPVNCVTEILKGPAAPSRPTRHCALVASSERPASSGSTCRTSTSCGVQSGRTAPRLPACLR